MLSVFIKGMMESTSPKESIPIVLVLMTDEKIIGIVPLLLTKKFGIRFAKLLLDVWFSPDFIFDIEYSKVCMQSSLNFIFNHLGCQFVTLYLPDDSLNLPILKQICEINHMHFRRKNEPWLNHSVISVDRTWDDFQKSQSKNFRHRFKQIERRLSRAGQWQILLFEHADHEQEVLGKIMDIEKTSWKQNWRRQHNALVDESLLKFWEISSFAIRTYPDFERSVWFLELNGDAIAYSLVVQYEGTAYIAKTSYNNQYRKIYPGIYVNNAAIQNLFNCDRIKIIDLMTNLPFHEIWKSKHLLRVELSLWKGFLPNLFESIIQRQQIRTITGRLIPAELVQQLPLV